MVGGSGARSRGDGAGRPLCRRSQVHHQYLRLPASIFLAFIAAKLFGSLAVLLGWSSQQSWNQEILQDMLAHPHGGLLLIFDLGTLHVCDPTPDTTNAH